MKYGNTNNDFKWFLSSWQSYYQWQILRIYSPYALVIIKSHKYNTLKKTKNDEKRWSKKKFTGQEMSKWMRFTKVHLTILLRNSNLLNACNCKLKRSQAVCARSTMVQSYIVLMSFETSILVSSFCHVVYS